MSSRSRPGRAAVRVGVHDELGAAAERAVGGRVHVADDHVRLEARLEDRVGAAVHRRPAPAARRARTGAASCRSFWWSTPRTTTSAGRSRKRVSKSGSSIRPASRSRSSRMWVIVFSANASIASPICRRPLLVRARRPSRGPAPRPPPATGSSPVSTSPPRTRMWSPSLTRLEQRRAGHVDEVHAGLARGSAARCSGSSASTTRATLITQRTPVATRSSAETRSMPSWSIDRDVARLESLHEPLGALPEPRRALVFGRGKMASIAGHP